MPTFYPEENRMEKQLAEKGRELAEVGISLEEALAPIGPDNPGGPLAPLPGDYCTSREDPRPPLDEE